MEFTGVVTHIGEKETFGETFSKIAVRLEETEGQYPQSASLDFANKMLEKAETLKVWDILKVGFNIRSNESKKTPWKFFNGLNAWKVDFIGGGETAAELPDDSLPF